MFIHMDVVAWITLFLCVATVWLGWETRKVAIAAKSSFELEALPYIALKSANLSFTAQIGAFDVQANLVLSNPGKVLVHYHVNSFTVTMPGCTPPPGATVLTHGAVIHPGSEMTHFHAGIRVPVPLANPITADVDFDLSYWTVLSAKKSFRASVRVLCPAVTPGTAGTWLYINGPSYS